MRRQLKLLVEIVRMAFGNDDSDDYECNRSPSVARSHPKQEAGSREFGAGAEGPLKDKDARDVKVTHRRAQG